MLINYWPLLFQWLYLEILKVQKRNPNILEAEIWPQTKGSLNEILIIVSISLKYIDNSSFCWRGNRINEERG